MSPCGGRSVELPSSRHTLQRVTLLLQKCSPTAHTICTVMVRFTPADRPALLVTVYATVRLPGLDVSRLQALNPFWLTRYLQGPAVCCCHMRTSDDRQVGRPPAVAKRREPRQHIDCPAGSERVVAADVRAATEPSFPFQQPSASSSAHAWNMKTCQFRKEVAPHLWHVEACSKRPRCCAPVHESCSMLCGGEP